MGKSTAAATFRRLGVPVHDSDAVVHKLMARGGAAVPAIKDRFPACVQHDVVDRVALGQQVFGDPIALKRLEAVLHPLVRRNELKFLGRHARSRSLAVVLDVPLLFETGGERRCDAVAVVSAPYREQKRRVLRRQNMSPAKFENILTHQISDVVKRKRADFVIHSGLGRVRSLQDIANVVTVIRTMTGTHWPPFWQRRSTSHERNRP